MFGEADSRCEWTHFDGPSNAFLPKLLLRLTSSNGPLPTAFADVVGPGNPSRLPSLFLCLLQPLPGGGIIGIPAVIVRICTSLRIAVRVPTLPEVLSLALLIRPRRRVVSRRLMRRHPGIPAWRWRLALEIALHAWCIWRTPVAADAGWWSCGETCI